MAEGEASLDSPEDMDTLPTCLTEVERGGAMGGGAPVSTSPSTTGVMLPPRTELPFKEDSEARLIWPA